MSRRRSIKPRQSSAELLSKAVRRVLRPLGRPVAESLEARRMMSTTSVYSFDYGQGFNGNGVALNGGATYSGKALSLTDGGLNEARSAFYSAVVPVSAFDTHTAVKFTNGAANGMTFTVQTVGATAVGSSGTGFGYKSIGTASEAITFDLVTNTVGIAQNGAAPTTTYALRPAGITLASGHVIDIGINYDGSKFTVTEADESANTTATQTFTTNLTGVVGNTFGYIGWTAGTSSTSTSTTLSDWTYTDNSATPSGGLNVSEAQFADAMRFSDWVVSAANQTPISGTAIDANGWPTGNATLRLGSYRGGKQNGKLYAGAYAISFNGTGTLTPDKYGTVTNQLYDAGTNTTTATYTLLPEPWTTDFVYSPTIAFTNTHNGAGTGVTNLRAMMPTSYNATTSFATSQLFQPAAIAEAQNFNVLRYMVATGASRSIQTTWASRTLPGNPSQTNLVQDPSTGSYNPNGMAWEYVTAFANASNTDIWINIPYQTIPYGDTTYVTDLANLIKYGSDGVNPYTSTQASPVFAPLNPTLKVYIELSNEIWNANFNETQIALSTATADVQAYLNHTGTSAATEGSVIDYDGIAGTNAASLANSNVLADRLNTLKLKQTSDAFRAVYGDAAMGSKIRPVYEFAGSGSGNVNSGVLTNQGDGSDALEFMNNYFNNGDVAVGGTPHVATAHSVNYFFWGGGTGFYGGDAIESDALGIKDSSFESHFWSLYYGATYSTNGSMGTLNTPYGSTALGLVNGAMAVQFPVAPVTEPQDITFAVAAGSGATGTLSLLSNGATLWSGNASAFSTTAFQTTELTNVNFTAGSPQLKFIFSGTGSVYVDDVTAAPFYNPNFDMGLAHWVTTGTVGPSKGGDSLGNPGAPGTFAAYLEDGGSVSQSMYFQSGNTAIAFSAAIANLAGGTYAKGYFTLTIDGASVALFGGNRNPVVLRSNLTTRYNLEFSDAVNYATAGMHAVVLTYHNFAGYTGRAFVTGVEVDSANTIYSPTVPAPRMAQIQQSGAVVHSYGLHNAAYEGAYFPDDGQLDYQTPLQIASLGDARLTAQVAAFYAETFAEGCDLPVWFLDEGVVYGALFDHSGNSPTTTLAGLQSVLNGTTPQINSASEGNTRPASPSTVLENVTLYYPPKQTGASTKSMYAGYFYAATAGYYNAGASFSNALAGKANVTMDGAVLGTIDVGAGQPSEGDFEVYLAAGLHSVQVTNIGTTNLTLNDIALDPDTGPFTSNHNVSVTAATDVGTATTNAATGVYTITGSGAGIAGTGDQFNYLDSIVSNDQSLTARITALTGASAAAGVMFRGSITGNDLTAAVVVTAGGVELRTRSSAGATMAVASIATAVRPMYVRLTRQGHSFAGFYSTDGSTWTAVGSPVSIAMGATYLSGLAVSSGVSGTLSTATIDSVVSRSLVVSSWIADASGNWSDTANWSNGVVPNGVGAEADLTAAITAARTITLDVPVVLGTLKIGGTSTGTFYLNQGANGSLTLDTGGAGSATITQTIYSSYINAPITLNSDLNLHSLSTLGYMNLQGAISGNQNISVNPDAADVGTPYMRVANTFTGNLNLSHGSLLISPEQGFGDNATGTRVITISNNAILRVNSGGGMTLGANRQIVVSATGGTINLNGAGLGLNLNYTGQLTGSGNLTIINSGTFSIAAAQAGYTGTLILDGGTTKLTGAGTIGAAKIIAGDTAAASAVIFDVSGVTGGYTLASGKTLSGFGKVAGNVATASGSHIAAGNSAIGTLTFNNNLTAAAGTNLDFTLGSVGVASKIAVLGALALPTSGSVTVNLADNAGANGQGSFGNGTYSLFSYATLTNSFSTAQFALGSVPTGHTYMLSNDATNKLINLLVS